MAPVAPVVEPAHPELRTHQRPALRVLAQRPEALLGPGAEVPCGQGARKLPSVQALRERAVRCHQRHLHAAPAHQLPDFLQVAAVIGVIAVLVLHLHQDDGASLGALPGGELREQHLVILLHMPQEGAIAHPQPHAVLSEQPGGQTAELPLRADVGGGPDDHIQAQLPGQPDESLDVQHPLEAKLPLLLLVHVPGDVGLHRVAAHTLKLLQPVPPVLRHDPEIVHRTGDDPDGLSVQIEIVPDFKCAHNNLSFHRNLITS